MALNGVGGNGGSALERFQAIRDSAKKKIDGEDGQAGLAELIKRKQAQLGTAGIAAKPTAERIPPGLGTAGRAAGNAGASQAATGNAASMLGPAGYGKTGGLQKQDSRPTLGRHVDFMA
ncbi:MAG: hypothetical protein JWP91_2450 [Fibrobacteres bacterium]|nr:hypothetical protein [Fibrobacterota bacterium]